MSDDKWIPAADALDLIAWRFATKKLDTNLARDEAKTALVGGLASGRLHSCPNGCLTSAFEAGEGRPSDFIYYKLDADGNSSSCPMDVQHEGEYVFVPPTFWNNFRNPAAGASANWHDGHFSFQLEMPMQTTIVGEVRRLCFARASIEQIGVGVLAAAMERTGDPGRPSLSVELYTAEFERRKLHGATLPVLADEAKALLFWLRQTHPGKPAPTAKTIRERIRPAYNVWKATPENK